MILDKGKNGVSFAMRLFSFLIDIVVINLIVLWPFANSIEGYLTSASKNIFNPNYSMPSQIYLIILIMSLLALFYFAFFEYYMGQTPGQMILKIKVIGPKEITIWTAIMRNCYIIPFFPFYLLWLVDPIYLGIYKIRFLEKITGTTTVSEKSNYFTEYKLHKI